MIDREHSKQLRHKLAEKIKEVFSNTAYPDEIYLTRYSSEIGEEFVNLKWQDVPEELLKRHKGDLIGLHPDVFRYYLPAILRAILLEEDGISDLHGSMINWLGPNPGRKYHERWFPRMAEGLTNEQREVIYTLYASYSQLFPNSSWPYSEWDHGVLSRALEYWAPTDK
jgi:hypothetical protein